MDNLTGIGLIALAALLASLEHLPTIRRQPAPIAHRWATNIGLVLAGGLLSSVLFPATVAQVASEIQGGLLRSLQLPLAIEAVLVFLLMDFWRYWEHRIFHEVPWFWRLHLVHHSDTAIDVTTSQRHHPIEAVVVTLLAFMLLFALGFSAKALAVYLVASTVFSLWSHANISLPEGLDKSMRGLFVTPAVHAIHHSSYQPETDSNYGAVLTIWDRLFGTYNAPGLTPARFGLEYFRGPTDTDLLSALLQPFKYSPKYADSVVDTAAAGTAKQQASPPSHAWRRALQYSCIGLALTLLLFWPTAVELGRLWTQADAGAYQYAWLVLPMFVYLVGWYNREHILAMTPGPGYGGLPLAFSAVVLWLVTFTTDFKLGQQLALVLMLQAVALCTLGRDTYRQLLPTMMLLFLMIPCGDIVQPLLRDLTLNCLEWFAILGGLPHSVDGYHITFGEHEYEVLSACSGLGLFTLAGFLGYSFGLMLYHSLARVLAMAALGAMLGILANCLRVCLIVTLDLLSGTQMELADHKGIQWLVTLLLLGGLLVLVARLKRDDHMGTQALPPIPA